MDAFPKCNMKFPKTPNQILKFHYVDQKNSSHPSHNINFPGKNPLCSHKLAPGIRKTQLSENRGNLVQR